MKLTTLLRGSALVFLLIALLCPVMAKADVLYQFNAPFTGDPDPTTNSGPWIDASFLDVTPGEVLLTVTNVNLLSSEFVQGNGMGSSGGLFFNLNTNDSPIALNFSIVSSNGDFGPMVSTGTNAFMADGDGKYDIQIDFSNHMFSADSSITFEITGIANLTSADFEYLSDPAGGQGPFYAAAKVQGIPGSVTSTFLEPGNPQVFSVPEPSPSIILFAGFGLFSVGRLWCRRIKAKAVIRRL